MTAASRLSAVQHHILCLLHIRRHAFTLDDLRRELHRPDLRASTLAILVRNGYVSVTDQGWLISFQGREVI